MFIQNIPESLKTGGRFCVWKYIDRDGKKTKCPFNPLTGAACASNEPLTFGTFFQAKLALETGNYDGLGVGIFGDICAIDIDNCIDADGNLSARAKDIISAMQSYTELSPSGKGVHIWFRADGFEYDKTKYYINNQSEGVEVYVAGATNKFVTTTGDCIDCGYDDLQDRAMELTKVLDRYMLRKSPQKANVQISVNEMPHLTDEEIVRLVVAHNDRFGPILNGDISDYDYDQSRADMALCAKLAFYTRDPVQIDRIYRNSGLCRKDGKWDRKQSGSTYGRLTIEKALDFVAEQYGGKQVRGTGQNNKHECLTEKISHAQLQAACAIDSHQIMDDTVKDFVPEC